MLDDEAPATIGFWHDVYLRRSTPNAIRITFRSKTGVKGPAPESGEWPRHDPGDLAVVALEFLLEDSFLSRPC
jgi:hypothetical protein